jgi:hypothetical protein
MESGVGEIFPSFSISEKIPYSAGSISPFVGTMNPGPVASTILHCSSLRFIVHSLFAIKRQSHYNFGASLSLIGSVNLTGARGVCLLDYD